MTTVLQNLKESNEFLNLLLENINSAVLIADENLQIHRFKKLSQGTTYLLPVGITEKSPRQ